MISWTQLKSSLPYFPAELFSAALVYSLPLQKRKGCWVRKFSAILLSYVILTGLYIMGYRMAVAKYLPMELSTVSACILLFVCMALIVWCGHEVFFRESVYCAVCAYLMEHVAYCVRILAGGLAGRKIANGSAGYFLIFFLVYLAAWFLFTRRMVQDGHYVTGAVNSIGVTLSALSVVVVMSIVATTYGFERIHAVYAIFCCIFVLSGQVWQQKQLSLQEKLQTQQQLWLRHKAQYEMARESIDIINRKCHDLKHQVAALKHIRDPEKKERAIASIEDSVMIYDSILETGNEILDTVLTEKSLLCRKKHIVINCIADGARLSFMDAVDLYALFGNALDNAMEALDNLPEEERFISLLVQEKAGLVLIQAENPYEGVITLKDGLPQSRKEDNGYHGFGLKSIREIASRYRGFLTIETDHCIFMLRITIPLQEQPQNAAKK